MAQVCLWPHKRDPRLSAICLEPLTPSFGGRIFAANNSFLIGSLEVDPWLTVQPLIRAPLGLVASLGWRTEPHALAASARFLRSASSLRFSCFAWLRESADRIPRK